MTTTLDSPRKRWRIADEADEGVVARLQEETGLDRPICVLMALRGLHSAEQARRFLKPSLERLHDPRTMKGVDAIVERLVRARESEELVGIHGDYDVDGLTSATLYTRVLEELGFRVQSFVPHRMIDGYGVSARAVDAFAEAGVDVLLTCDAGISDHEVVARARDEHGMDVLVTDHHTPPDTLPPAHAIANPHQAGCAYPFKGLCGAGIAFKVLQALVADLGLEEREVLFPYLDLVALGTICDVVPLVGENRVLAHWGLKVARRTRNLGLRQLFEVAERDPAEVDEGTFGWVIGPRLNAVGRIDDAGKGLELLTADDSERAAALSREIDTLNRNRQDLSAEIEQDAIERVEAMELEDVYGIVLFGDERWHHGVIGIVASRIVERFGRPAFLFARDPETGHWKGSGRAPTEVGVNLHEALIGCESHLLRYGGHAGAAGATLEASTPEERDAFRAAFDAAVAEQMDPDDRIPVLRADLAITLDRITPRFYDLVRRFAPFGHENEEVTLVARGVKVTHARRIGRNKTHVKLQVEQNGERREALGWGMAEEVPDVLDTPVPYRADLIFRVQENTYRGRTSLQLVLKDIRITEQAEQVTLDAIAGRDDSAHAPDPLFADA